MTKKRNLDFTNETTTYIRFPTDREFAGFREEIEDRYDSRMVRVVRYQVTKDGTVAILSHAGCLGAELRGTAHGHFDGHTLSSVDH